MRGIDEETLLAVRASLAAEGLNTDVIDALISLKIRELNPWMTLEEFLKSGFEGLCWVCVNKVVYDLIEYRQGAFYFGSSKLRTEVITDVQPIHKPEPPR